MMNFHIESESCRSRKLKLDRALTSTFHPPALLPFRLYFPPHLVSSTYLSMSNIHTINPNAGDELPIQNPWTTKEAEQAKTGRGQSVSGKTGKAPWDRPTNTESVHTPPRNSGFHQAQHLAQSRIQDPFWSDNTPINREQTVPEIMANWSGFGCCVGPCCSPTRKADWRRFFFSFTFIMTAIQTIVFIVECIVGGIHWPSLGPSMHALILLGAKETTRIKCKFQIFRFITPVLLHAGIFHFLFNMFFQYRVMLYREMKWGHGKTIAIYLFSALSATILSCVMSPTTVSVGASGALLGIYGGYVVCIAQDWNKMPNMVKGMHIMNVGSYLLFMLIWSFSSSGIDFGAHLGGFCGGLLISLSFLCQTKILRIIGLVGYLLLTVLPLGLFLFVLPPKC
ncbi:putative rhomboid family protein [Blattamonas nauphoetae]|uniref:rhomboid protease n=1 Tax=Blattamonas nauphoetae TaxID=2049346 RepID=A0ABQ9YD50_9EUKA|nr:putative rhomboid family protein [Blattamonas nauphoetae]